MPFDDIFSKRIEFGKTLGECFNTKGISKSEFCSLAGISRPTLDKIIKGEIQSRTTFQKYVDKILSQFDITLEEFFGHRINKGTNSLSCYIKAFRYTEESLSKKTGISLSRIKNLEKNISIASKCELLALAFSLEISTADLTGETFFLAQTSWLDDFLDHSNDEYTLDGAWGQMGVLVSGKEKSKWFPISAGTENEVKLQFGDNGFAFVRTLNNQILLLNMKNIKRIVFLDDGADEYRSDWEISEGDIDFCNSSLFEALMMCYDCEVQVIKKNPEVPTNVFKTLTDLYGNKTAKEIEDLINLVTVVYEDGKEEKIYPEDFSYLTHYIEEVFWYGNFDRDKLPLLELSSEGGGANVIINPERISYISIPFERIRRDLQEFKN